MTSKDDTSWILFEKYPIWFWPSFHCLRFYGALKKIFAPTICHNCRKIIHIWFKTPQKYRQTFMIIEIIDEALRWRTFIHRGYIQYINLLDKSFRVKSKNSLEFLSFSKETFLNNVFLISISKPKLLMPRNSCILC